MKNIFQFWAVLCVLQLLTFNVLLGSHSNRGRYVHRPYHQPSSEGDQEHHNIRGSNLTDRIDVNRQPDTRGRGVHISPVVVSPVVAVSLTSVPYPASMAFLAADLDAKIRLLSQYRDTSDQNKATQAALFGFIGRYNEERNALLAMINRNQQEIARNEQEIAALRQEVQQLRNNRGQAVDADIPSSRRKNRSARGNR